MKNLSNIPGYAEIGITTNFSFLRGGSDPRAYVHQASELGIPAIGIADHNTLAGVVRAYKELDNPEVKHKTKLLIGARLVFIDGAPDILVYPRDRTVWRLRRKFRCWRPTRCCTTIPPAARCRTC